MTSSGEQFKSVRSPISSTPTAIYEPESHFCSHTTKANPKAKLWVVRKYDVPSHKSVTSFL
jgi:hypothetical protein